MKAKQTPALLAPAVRAALRIWQTKGRTGDAAHAVEDALRGQLVELRPGTVITVAAVANAGSLGLQVGGYEASGEYRIGYYQW